MIQKMTITGLIMAILILFAGCGAKKTNFVMNPDSVAPGTMVSSGDQKVALLGNPIKTGDMLPDTTLTAADSLKEIDLKERYRGKVMFLSIVPSLDTKVCEAQTHYLGEEGDVMPDEIARITISRDTPFAQTRFAEESGLTGIEYYSDYKTGQFGNSTGLLVDGSMLLARSIVIVDREGIVRYIQVVPQIGNLPDMERAFAEAGQIAKTGSGSGM